jgi:four helix bundle protein
MNQAQDLLDRTKQFALRVLKMADALPQGVAGKTIANQIARSACSVAANYRASQRARSKAEFIAKLSIVHEEADETLFWIEMIEEANLLPPERLISLKSESNEIVAILVTSLKSAKSNK